MVWYDSPAQAEVKRLVDALMESVPGVQELGGVLITRIASGKCCRVHNDAGYNALEFSKYAIQVQGDKHQGFCFEDTILHPTDGETFWFYNQADHWVYNCSYRDRITLIVSMRTDRGISAP
jgi:hypothetical protein